MENQILEILKELKLGQEETNKRLASIEEETSKRLTNIENEIKSFKDQFTDFEGKSANNHVEIINKIDDIQKDLNKVELVTASNWVEVAKLKSVK